MVEDMGHFGFSYIGLLWLLMLFVPNLLWIRRKPAGYDPAGENRGLLVLGRGGGGCVTGTALLFEDYDSKLFTFWSLWLSRRSS